MKETLYILITVLFLSCSEKAKKSESEDRMTNEQIVSTETNTSDEPVIISQQEKEFNEFLGSIKAFKIQPNDPPLPHESFRVAQSKSIKNIKNATARIPSRGVFLSKKLQYVKWLYFFCLKSLGFVVVVV